jgi:predicted aspartyl protease
MPAMIEATQPSVRWALPLLAPLLLGATPPTATPPPAAPVPATPPGEMTVDPVTGAIVPVIQPFDLDATRRMSVQVTVGGKGPFSFLVDTGAERTVIARELAERLKLAPGEKLRLATIGSALTVPSFQVAALQMTNLSLNGFDAPAFDGRHIGAAGLIGVDMLENRRVLIDFRKQSMSIVEMGKRSRPIIRDDDAIVVTAKRLGGRLILSDATLDGKRIDVIVDTGAQTSVGNRLLQKLVADRRLNRSAFTPTTLEAVTGEAVPATHTVIKRMMIHGMDVNDLRVSFADAQAFRALGLDDRPALLLGMDCLSLFDRVEIDFANRRVVFDLPSAANSGTRFRFAANMATRGS